MKKPVYVCDVSELVTVKGWLFKKISWTKIGQLLGDKLKELGFQYRFRFYHSYPSFDCPATPHLEIL